MKGYSFLQLTNLQGALVEFHLLLDYEPKEEHDPTGNVELVKWWPDEPDPQLTPDALDLFLEQHNDETLDECINRKFEQLIVPMLNIPEYKQ